MKRILAFAALLAWFCTGFASEKDVPTSPLSVYDWGFAVGAVRSIDDSLIDVHRNFFQLSFINSVYLNDHMNLFVDAGWMAPGPNFGTDLGFDLMLSKSGFRPFIGAGVGARYFDKPGHDFGDNVGPSGTVHAGFTLDLTDAVAMQVKVPYCIVADKTYDQAVGLDIGFLFMNPWHKVRKFDYNG